MCAYYVLSTEPHSWHFCHFSAKPFLHGTWFICRGLLPPLVADSLKPTPIDQVLVIAHFLNSAVRVVIASGWNANPKLAKVSGKKDTQRLRITVKRDCLH